MKLSIVIPVYNSSSIIENLASDILAVSKNLSKISLKMKKSINNPGETQIIQPG